MSRYIIVILSFVIITNVAVFSQDYGIFKADENKYWQHIEKTIADFESKDAGPDKSFKVDYSEKKFPTNLNLYNKLWHNPPISQGNSGTCWAYATTSFLESEIYRLTGKKVKLSEMHTVYWEIIEKARRFVKKRGKSFFAQGSEGNAVTRIWLKYGVVPAKYYTAKKTGQKFHNHDPMFKEMKNYLKAVKRNNAWNEKHVLDTIKAIMEHHIGTPPKVINIDGKKFTPKEYLKTLKINVKDYVNLISLKECPYYEMAKYNVPDNWWHSKGYLNVPLKDFMHALKSALKQGYTIGLGGDVSEAGYDMYKEVAKIPSFDIPSKYIDENARQFRFSNKTTTDDHGIHCVGYIKSKDMDWFLIKDSGSGSRSGKNHGYMFYHIDYIKLKMMNITVHKDAIPEIWKKYQSKQNKK